MMRIAREVSLIAREKPSRTMQSAMEARAFHPQEREPAFPKNSSNTILTGKRQERMRVRVVERKRIP